MNSWGQTGQAATFVNSSRCSPAPWMLIGLVTMIRLTKIPNKRTKKTKSTMLPGAHGGSIDHETESLLEDGPQSETLPPHPRL